MSSDETPSGGDDAVELLPTLDRSDWERAPTPPLSQRLQKIFRRRNPVPNLQRLVANILCMEQMVETARRMLRETKPLLISKRVKLEGRVSELNRIESMRYAVRDFDLASKELESAILNRDYVSVGYFALEMQMRVWELDADLFKAEANFRESDRLRRVEEARAAHVRDPKLQARNMRIVLAAEELASAGNVHTVSAIAEAISKPGRPGEGLSIRTIRHILVEERFELPH